MNTSQREELKYTIEEVLINLVNRKSILTQLEMVDIMLLLCGLARLAPTFPDDNWEKDELAIRYVPVPTGLLVHMCQIILASATEEFSVKEFIQTIELLTRENTGGLH